MKTQYKFSISLLCLLFSICTWGQNTLSGIVTDASNGEPLIGVNVIVDGTATGTVTGIDGRYAISGVSENASITASYVGYIAQTLQATTTTLDFSLRENTEELKVVVVTANKVEEDLQKVPLAATVVTGVELNNQSATSTLDALATTPNVLTDTYGASLISISIRGLSTNFDGLGLEQAVGMYINDVYQPRGYGFNSTVFDVERVEILRGPQGTLFGKNTIGGVVHIITEDPKFANSGTVELSAGNNGYFQTRAKGNFKLSDKVALRVSGALSQRDGIITNATNQAVQNINNTDFFGFRGGLLIKPSDKVDILLETNYSKDAATDQPVTYLSKPNPDDALGIPADDWENRETNINEPFPFDRTQFGASGKVTAKVGSNTLTSITAYTSSEDISAQEVDATFLDMVYTERMQEFGSFSQELRLTSPRDQDFSWVGGLYFASESIKGGDNAFFGPDIVPVVGFLVGIPDLAFNNYGENIQIVNDMSSTSVAGYFSGTYQLSDGVSLTGGLRLTNESKELDTYQFVNEHPEVVEAFGVGLPVALEFGVPFGSQASPDNYSANNTALTGNLALNAAISDDASIYGSYTRGFKGAGFNFGINPSPGEESIIFNPEFINSFEVGLKSQFNNKVRLNAAAYYLTYNDKQEAVFEGTVLRVVTAEKASGIGLEGEISALVASGLTLEASGGFQNLEYDNFTVGDGAGGMIDLAGNRLFKSPRSNFHLGAQYSNYVSDDWKLLIRADLNNTGRSFNDIFNTPEIERQSASILNARLGFTYKNKYTLSLWGKNLTDEVYFAHGFVTFFGDFAGLNNGQTYGVDLRVNLY